MSNKNSSVNNIYQLDGRVPVAKAVPFGLQHVLAMFVSNLAPISIIAAAGGIFEGTLGLMAKYWRKIISPIVAASVVTAIGFSLFTVGARSFGGGYVEDFGSAENLILGTITLVACLTWNCLAKGYLKQLSVLVGLLVGYVVAVVFVTSIILNLVLPENMEIEKINE